MRIIFLTLFLLTNTILSSQDCILDEMETNLVIGQTDTIPVLGGATTMSIGSISIIKLGYIEDGFFVAGANNGMNVNGHGSNPAKDTIAIKTIAVGTQNLDWTDNDCGGSGDGTVTITVATALPVLWTKNLIVQTNDSKVKLNWSVVQQINIEKFIVEHSQDEKNFQSIGET